MRRHLLEKRFDFESRQRRMARGEHVVRDEFSASDVAHMTRQAKLGAPHGIADIRHAVFFLLFLV